MSLPSLVCFPELGTDVQRGPFALSPSSAPYSMSLAEVYYLFVDKAPYRSEREFVYEALSLYLRSTVSKFPSATFWLDGGFTTWKEWEAPGDVDIVVILDEEDHVEALTTEEGLQFWTLQGVASRHPQFSGLPRHQPYGGLIDSFPIVDDIKALGIWYNTWSTVKDQAGNILENVYKGFVEVTADEVIKI